MAFRESGGSDVPARVPEPARDWTFLTNHARVLLCIAADPDVRLRDVAATVGITERAAQHIVQQLEVSGYLERERVGRRNRYHLHAELPLRHPMDREHQVGELLAVLGASPLSDRARSRRRA
jgi:hypothetical protein